MKTLKYIWRNVVRNKLRSSLTILSVAFSLALMTLLYGYIATQDQWGVEAAQYHRIVVMNRQGFSGKVPLAYVDRVRSMDGVKAAVPYSWFGGNYEEEKMPFAQFATDPMEVFRVFEELKIDPNQMEAWQKDRQGCVCDAKLAERRGWKIGDKIRLKGTFYTVDLDLTLVGTFVGPINTDSLWFSMTYLDELLLNNKSPLEGNAGTIFAKSVDSPSMAKICSDIDTRFESSEYPTRSQTESAFAQMFSDMIGDIRSNIRYIACAIIFSLTLVGGNAMAMSMRERTTEVAVLKAIGFTRSRILGMVLGEAVLIGVLGGLLGILFGNMVLQMIHKAVPQYFPFTVWETAGLWIVALLLVSAFIGLASGLVPAIRAAQLSVVDGLRRVI